MSEERSWFRRFIEDFGKEPVGEPREFIPKPYRTRVFVAMVVVSAVALVLLLWLVVIPAIKAQQASSLPSRLAAAPIARVKEA